MDDECPFDGEISQARPPKPVIQSESEIERIENTPMESLSFKDFLQLKSGRDRFSKMKLADLKTAVSHSDCQSVSSVFADDPKAEATCLRWILRGLTAEKAIRKIKTDAEVASKARPNSRR
jgi:ribonuclease HI